jgi:hypothetical protein
MSCKEVPVKKDILKFYIDAGLTKDDAEMVFHYTEKNLTQFKNLVAQWPAGQQTQGAGGSTHT